MALTIPGRWGGCERRDVLNKQGASTATFCTNCCLFLYIGLEFVAGS